MDVNVLQQIVTDALKREKLIDVELLRDIAGHCAEQLFITEALLTEHGLVLKAFGRARVVDRIVKYDDLQAGGLPIVKGHVAVLIGVLKRTRANGVESQEASCG